MKKKTHFTSGMNIAMLLILCQTSQNFRIFLLKRQDAELLFCLWYLSLTHITYQSQGLEKMLNMMNFRNLKQTYCKVSTNASWINVIFGLRTCYPSGSVLRPLVKFSLLTCAFNETYHKYFFEKSLLRFWWPDDNLTNKKTKI